MDALTRRRRMQGYEALWLPGMDHAGIATQNVVERAARRARAMSRHDLGREAFVERVWEWKAEYGGTILGQMRRLGDGVDWSRERFTMDEGLSRAVQTIFKRLYDDGLIYRAERIINWCPRCLHRAVATSRSSTPDDDGELVSIRYGDGDDAIVVATTRAETMLGDTAVAVHPDDERYPHLVGTRGRAAADRPARSRSSPTRTSTRRSAPARSRSPRRTTPTTSRSASGTTCRSLDDHGRARRDHRARPVRGPGPVRGPAGGRRGAARARAGSSPRSGRTCTRSGTARAASTDVEPRLSLQWFVKVEPLAKAAGDAVRDGRVDDRPGGAGAALLRLGRQHARLVHLAASCGGATASRSGTARTARSSASARTRSRRPARAGRQDDDVLDTWFSSALWPFSTLGWPDETADLREVLPDHRPGHRLRHPVLLGRPDDDVRPVRDGRRAAVRRGRAARPGPRPVRQEDVEVVRQRRRPARLDGRVRRRRAPLHPGPRRQPRRRRADRRGVGRRARATSATSSGTPPGSR